MYCMYSTKLHVHYLYPENFNIYKKRSLFKRFSFNCIHGTTSHSPLYSSTKNAFYDIVPLELNIANDVGFRLQLSSE
jgi:hypothetical protein